MPRDYATLRDHARVAAARLRGPSQLYRCCALHDLALQTGESNLKKFLDGDNATINIHDFDCMSTFLYCTDLGNRLCGIAVGPVRDLQDFINVLRNGAAGTQPHHLEGSYFGYHGSFMRPSQFVKLALLFSSHDGRCIKYVVQFLADHPLGIRRATGFAVFRNGRLQLLSYNNDNADGFALILAARLYSSEGIVQHIVGVTQGANIDGEAYSRAVLIRKTPVPMTLDKMMPSTGIKPWAGWPREDQEVFRELGRSPPRTAFDDPTLEL